MRGWYYDPFMYPFELAGMSAVRSRLLSHAQGKTLEIGMGTGLNLKHYPAGVELTAIEPDAELREIALKRGAPVVDGDAQALPQPDASQDTVVATFVFCSIPDWKKALSEAVRVLKPGGKLLMFDHIKPQGFLGALADLATPPWSVVAHGCHLDREPQTQFEPLGLKILEEGKFWFGFGRWWVLGSRQGAPN